MHARRAEGTPIATPTTKPPYTAKSETMSRKPPSSFGPLARATGPSRPSETRLASQRARAAGHARSAAATHAPAPKRKPAPVTKPGRTPTPARRWPLPSRAGDAVRRSWRSNTLRAPPALTGSLEVVEGGGGAGEAPGSLGGRAQRAGRRQALCARFRGEPWRRSKPVNVLGPRVSAGRRRACPARAVPKLGRRLWRA